MADEIMERDVQAGIEMAWHKKTKVVPVVQFADAFPFEINRTPLSFAIANDAVRASLEAFLDIASKYQAGGKGITKATVADAKAKADDALRLLQTSSLPGFAAFVADDDKLICGKPVPDTYGAMTNAQFWATCSDALEGTGAVIESAGTMMDRTRRFLTIKLPDDATKIGGRTFKNRISMIDAIDQTLKFHAVNTSVCVVCANTARMVIGDTSGEFHFQLKHTSGFIEKIEDMESVIEGMIGVQAHFNEALRIAAEVPLSVDDARPLFAGWLGEKAKGGISSRAVNTSDRLVELFTKGAGNNGETLLDAVSAVTDFYSHESSGGEDLVKQSLSSEFGAGSTAKTKFINSLFLTAKGRVLEVDQDGIRDTQRRGIRLLSDYAAANPK